VSGSEFRDTPAVTLNTGATTIPADNVTRISAETITCTFDLSVADAGSWSVRVTNDDGKAGVLPAGFSVTNQPPHITAITPGAGTAGDTLSGVIVTGSGFFPSPQVKLQQSGQPYIHAGDVVRINGTHITCTLDLGGAAPGAWDVIVRNTDGKEDTLSAAFTVDEAVAPAPEPTATPAPRRTSSGNDDGSSTVVACGSDLVPGKNCTLTLPSGPVREVTLRVTAETDSVLVTAKECGLPASIEQPNGTTYRCTEVTLYRICEAEVESVWFTFSVPGAWLEEWGFSPSGVSMLRFHEGAWQDLPTIFVEEREGMAWFRAMSPGCSLFAIICKADSSGVNTGDVGEGASRDTIAPTAAPAPVPSLTPAEPLPPGFAGSTPATTQIPRSPLAAAPLLSLPLALLLRRHR
jgi:PGF-pre-PGF domain-containing protein